MEARDPPGAALGRRSLPGRMRSAGRSRGGGGPIPRSGSGRQRPSRLSSKDTARVENARHEARQRLLAETQEPIAPELTSVLGLPNAAASARLIAALAPLWS